MMCPGRPWDPLRSSSSLPGESSSARLWRPCAHRLVRVWVRVRVSGQWEGSGLGLGLGLGLAVTATQLRTQVLVLLAQRFHPIYALRILRHLAHNVPDDRVGVRVRVRVWVRVRVRVRVQVEGLGL